MNAFDKQILEEGYRNAVVKLTGSLDTGNFDTVSAISPADFTNNDPNFSRVSGLRVDHITYSIGDGIELQLAWNSFAPQQIAPIAGRGKIDATCDGGFIPDASKPGYDGTINLFSTGFIPGAPQNFTVFLRLVKLYNA